METKHKTLADVVSSIKLFIRMEQDFQKSCGGGSHSAVHMKESIATVLAFEKTLEWISDVEGAQS